jgi:hypothetical protein
MVIITPNEATITGAVLGAVLGALFGGVVSFLTARYAIKHGPDYGPQITDIHAALASLAQTQEDLRQDQANAAEIEGQRAEAATWRPRATIVSATEGSQQTNTFHVHSIQSFALTEACLVSTTGVKMHQFAVLGPLVFSKRFSVVITQESLVKIVQNTQTYFQSGKFDAAIRYTVEREGPNFATYTGELPFRAESISVDQTMCYRLQG